MHLDARVCDRARRARDARFDGRFFIGVTTTGVYCRPICPARAPKDEHVRYFPTAAAAEAAGFRPCLRCRPEAAPGTPAWLGTSGLVSRALRMIGDGALRCDATNGTSVHSLADRLGVTARHLRRLFLQHLGATPLDVALTRRAHFAKKLVDETSLAFHQVAIASGFGSLRRFNAEIRRTYARTPTQLRRLARQRPAAESDADCYGFRLAYRPPYDWDAMLAFLGARATPGVESVAESRYRRTIAIDGRCGSIEVSRLDTGAALGLDVRFPDPRLLLVVVERVRRMFDLGADPAIIGQHLRADPLLRAPLGRHPGIRTPGAWDGFELAVRAILGQQIAVRAATTMAGRVAAMFGSPGCFPTPVQLASAPLEQAGIVRARAESIRLLARRVVDGTIAFDSCVEAQTTMGALKTIPGIGDWTAEYIAMRALGEPDAFPRGDLVLRRMAGDCTPRDLERRSQAWRPWRAYAVILLWQAANDLRQRSSRNRHAKSESRSTLRAGDRHPVVLSAAHGAR